jgi:glycosyltransferase involved in cell wall biosynthesis
MLRAMLPAWRWRILELPPRFFSWRVRGNALYWSMTERDTLEQDYDLLIATSMADLATLRGLVPALANIPAVVYFHENQFAYPQGEHQHSLLDAQLTSIYSALAADRVLFNSRYNRESFLAGCAELLGKLPDRVPPGVVEALDGKSNVLAVPIDCCAPVTTRPFWHGIPATHDGPATRLLWVGRFEHDKGGDVLLAILRRLEESGFDYELALTGQQFRQSPAVFDTIRTTFEHRLVHCGYLEDVGSYRGLLAAADIVLSTAHHEFQGLAVLEAVSLGCVPVVPNRLAYVEIYPEDCRYASHPDDVGREARAAADLIVERAVTLRNGNLQPPDVSAFCMGELASRYQRLLLDSIADGMASLDESR